MVGVAGSAVNDVRFTWVDRQSPDIVHPAGILSLFVNFIRHIIDRLPTGVGVQLVIKQPKAAAGGSGQECL
jgi:hypothetical protein